MATTAGRLPARWVVHTVGPVWSASEDRSELLADCHRNSLRGAAEFGAKTVAFAAADASVDLVRFVLSDQAAYDAYARP